MVGSRGVERQRRSTGGGAGRGRTPWTASAIGVANQQRDTIVVVDPERGTISIERQGQVREINLAEARHLDHGYADTVRGRAAVPAERVIAHLPVDNVELTNLQAVIDIALQSRNHLTIVTENAARLVQAVEDRPGRAPAAAGSSRSMDRGIGGEGLRHEATAKEYVERSPVHRDASLVIDPTRAGVDAVSRIIREKLAEREELAGTTVKMIMLQDAGLTRTERAELSGEYHPSYQRLCRH